MNQSIIKIISYTTPVKEDSVMTDSEVLDWIQENLLHLRMFMEEDDDGGNYEMVYLNKQSYPQVIRGKDLRDCVEKANTTQIVNK